MQQQLSQEHRRLKAPGRGAVSIAEKQPALISEWADGSLKADVKNKKDGLPRQPPDKSA